MSLRKSPTLTPELLKANRRNARKSTGPRTARGKAQVRFNALRHGWRSRYYRALRKALLLAPAGAVLGPHRFLTAEMARHPLFAEAIEVAIEAEIGSALHFSGADRQRNPRNKALFEQSEPECY